jgi:predicted PurR-regulated permease PerM
MTLGTRQSAAAIVVFVACAYLLRGLAAPICWAALIAIATWPLHQRLLHAIGRGGTRSVSAALLTAAVVLVLLVPIGYLVYEGARELPAVTQLWETGRDTGIAPPQWLGRLPWIGPALVQQWQAGPGQPGALAEYVRTALGERGLHTGRVAVLWLGHRAMELFFCLFMLFFLYLDGATIGRQVDAVLERQFGHRGIATKRLAVDAVRGTVNGLILVGLGLAIVMSVAYAVAGVRHPALAGLATGLLGMVPFGAMVAVVAVVLYLLAVGAPASAVGVLAFGGVAIFLADHFVRPWFISGASHLPLVLALLGIVAGLETFGVLGLFIGPTILAVGLTIWRELAADARQGP